MTIPSVPLPDDIDVTVSRALAEDIGTGDVTATLVPNTQQSRVHVITREAAVLCGTAWFDAVFRQLDTAICVAWKASDGDSIQPDQELCVLEGPTRPLLTGERTALNFLQTLSGTATATCRYVELLSGTVTKLLDTRKTIPGLRKAQKYAVRCGGGHNHRMGLYDGILIKENHIAAAGSITNAVTQAKRDFPAILVEVEVETFAQMAEGIAAGADILLLDNFSIEQLAQAVQINAGRVRLEASGGFTAESLRAAAATGVDYISVGSLTKHVRAVDLSLRFL